MAEERRIGEIVAVLLVHSQMILNGYDDLEERTNIRRQLKFTVNQAKKELEKLSNEVHGKVSDDENNQINTFYDDYFAILNILDKLTVLQRNKLKEQLPDLIKKIKS